MLLATREFVVLRVKTYQYTWHTYTVDDGIRCEVYCDTLINGQHDDTYIAYATNFPNTREGAVKAGSYGHRMAALGAFQRERDLLNRGAA